MPLAGGIVLQVDQAKPADQTLFRHDGQRGQDASLDRHLRLRAGGHCAQGASTGDELVPNPTDFECERFRANPSGTTGYTNLISRQS